MPKTVWVLYHDGSNYQWKEMICNDVTSTKPEDFQGLHPKMDKVILVVSRFQGGDVYLEGQLTGAYGR